MNTSHSAPRFRSENGVALVIVLGCLVLLSTLVVAFMASISGEHAASKIYAAGANTRFLSDSAVNAVMGQIAEATRGALTGTTTRVSWASQPGMIRTYDDQGNLGNIYKLYSASRMVAPGGNAKSEMAADVPTGWQDKPALFTDLNAPVADANQELRFPIIDGNLKELTVNNKKVLTYDGKLNESGDGVPDIEGFGIDPASVPNYHGGAPSADNNPAAMPSQWIYVLKDGTLVSPDSGGGTAATFSGANQPTKENPITGRIAFWTDDESSKLNINTASEGIYTAYARTNSPMEMCNPYIKVNGQPKYGYSVSYPARGEYNRYPGHPASTCLSVALQKWIASSSIPVVPNAYTSQVSDNRFLTSFQQYFAIAPKLAYGGSKAGTVAPIDASEPQKDYRGFWGKPVNPDTDRLYASVDELMFQPARTKTSDLPSVTLDKTALEKLRFFLTASSRSAEVTPFNTPKMSLWPQWKTRPDRDRWKAASEGLLEFCSSFGQAPAGTTPSGKFEYFFQRNRPLPGGGMNPSYMSCSQDWNQVQRNQELANYLYKLGEQRIPGYGGAFVSASKYPQITFNSIIVASLDMIRYNSGGIQYLWPYQGPSGGNSTMRKINPLVVTFGLPGMPPSRPANPAFAYKGYGDFPSITQAALGVYKHKGDPQRGISPGSNRLFMIFDTFNPGFATGHPGWGNFNVRLSDMDKLGVVGFRAASNVIGASGNDANGAASIKPYIVDLWEIGDVPAVGGVINIGSDKPITISVLDDDQGDVIQKLQIVFPPTTMPAPTAAIDGCGGSATGLLAGDVVAPAEIYKVPPANPPVTFKTSLRGVECGGGSPIEGDWRLLAGTWATDPAYFQPTQGYSSDAKRPQIHKLRMFHWGAAGGDQRGGLANYEQTTGDPAYDGAGKLGKIPAYTVGGTLVPGFDVKNYSDFCIPAVPAGFSPLAAGDWDTGLCLLPDGPYINATNPSPRTIDGPPFGATWSIRTVGSNNWEANGVDSTNNEADGLTFSPNRQIASAVKLGSLPTGLYANEPWQTLLFCPNPASRTAPVGATDTGHKGSVNPPDHVYLEFFTMPTVEPYAISEPLSTAGKVNINYQLAPFTNIERSTAVRGVLKNTLMKGICGNVVKPLNTTTRPTPVQSRSYKLGSVEAGSGPEVNYDINRDATLEGIEDLYFKKGNVFRYASEICDVFLVPKKIDAASGNYASGAAPPPTSYKNMTQWWGTSSSSPLSTMRLTGDNLREEPYDRIYSRLTTKSNTYTVHYRVQVLKKRPNTPANEWTEGVDSVLAESRGATMIERYIDPSDATLNSKWDSDTRKVDLAADLSKWYKFRIISNKKFAP